ncbi:PP2C family protein-serine/threonine phosphatase [Subtercola sp. RTI3]|uniref:PP2C family protein-serine/threonine phosphatase n=1 Tax=Subtercola sp. RTI3 TaxID=3048639 RepID=UPI002B2246D7|nr:protein phosphatase 2C domain-containing protein [Subtercola sp. RTI3]MEA9986104.1 protein phosphatase 2C domain-containing protein [Subtercola sp. RTI3]
MSASRAPESLALDSLTTRVGAATDVGLQRATNEDAFFAEFPVFLVADGMGGHQAGEVASALAVDAFASLAGSASVTPTELRLAFDRARSAILAIASTGPRTAGTTVSGVALASNEGAAYWLVFNLGDSRTYRLNDGVLEQISVDHSVVQELVDEGELDRAAAAAHPGRNIITRALGGGGDSRPDYWLVPVEPGDRIMICSDGVSGELEDDAVTRILLAEADPQAAATRLVHESLLRGGRDNLTAVVVDAFDSTPDAPPPPLAPTTSDGHEPRDEDTIPRAAAGAGRNT